MNMIPRIQSVGAPPAQHADRITADMLRYIVAAQTARWNDVERIFRDARGNDGNPAAQRRLAEKLKIAGGMFFCGVNCDPGKRGRYDIFIMDVAGYDPATQDIITQVEAIPDKPWLACAMTLRESKGRNIYNTNSIIHLVVTHHALSRLTQRCHARTPKDVIVAVGSIWARFVEVQTEVLSSSGSNIPSDHRMRVKLENNLGDCYAVLRPNENGATRVVTTILGPDGI